MTTPLDSDGPGFMARLATAPISWGICEVPGWGVQLPVERVLDEMAELGFPATELGSDGYLPTDADQLRALLEPRGLSLLAAFIPLVLHEQDLADETLRRAEESAGLLEAAGARYFNTAPVTTWDWAPRTELSAEQWDHTLAMFDRIEKITDAHGLDQVVHSHVGTIVETKPEVVRVLDGCDVKFVLDTAHLAVGGYDPVDFVADAADRVGLVHIKDTNLTVADRLNRGEISLMEAVQANIFPPLGDGDLAIDRVIQDLEAAGYRGWYVLEQDVAITGPEPAVGSGPIEDVRRSVNYLRGLEHRPTA
ncbi:MAG: sugar phosphate isomerase/epimerase family protein [Acidimicrobiales bacterium]